MLKQLPLPVLYQVDYRHRRLLRQLAAEYKIHTGWLKIKCPTGQNAISRQPTEIFLPKFQDLDAKFLSLGKNCQSLIKSKCLNVLC